MDKSCEICRKTAKYKCPRCFIYYCSALCCKEHRKAPCEDKKVTEKSQDNEEKDNQERRRTPGIPRLEMLGKDEELSKLLANKHLRDLLLYIDKAENAAEVMDAAMHEPIFVEFADACLRIVDPMTEEKE